MADRLLVLASGSGTLLQAIIDSPLGSCIVAVGSDAPEAAALERARRAGIPAFSLPLADFPDRASWSAALQRAVDSFAPDLIVCAGFMRVLAPGLVAAYRGRIVNSHPALLPAFPGAHAVRDALGAGVQVTGCTVHLVDEGVDTGRILAQEAVRVEPEDDEASLHERIKVAERALLVTTLQGMVSA